LRKASLLALFLTIFIDLLGFGIVIPLLPFYARTFGASGTVIGLVMGIYSFMQFIFAPLWGRISDRKGRRPIILLSLLGSVVGYTIFALSQSLLWLGIARAVSGFAAASIGTAQAYAADITTPENRAKGMGLIGAAFGLGFILGPPIGGLLATVGLERGYHPNVLPGVFAAVLSFSSFCFAFFFLAESRTERSEVRKRSWMPSVTLMRGNRPLQLTLFAMFLLILSFAGMETTVTLHGRDRFDLSPKQLGFLFGLMGVIVAIIQGGVIGRLTKWLGERKVVMIGATSLMLGLALVPPVHRALLLIPIAVLIAAGQGLCYPSLSSLVTKTSHSTEHGAALGLSASVGSLARMTGPLIGGILYDVGGSGAAFFTAAGIMFLALLVAMRLQRLPLLEPEASLR